MKKELKQITFEFAELKKKKTSTAATSINKEKETDEKNEPIALYANSESLYLQEAVNH